MSIMFDAAKGDMAIPVMVLQVKMLGDRKAMESSLRPIEAVAIHAFIKGTFCFTSVLFVTLSARDKVDGICRFAICGDYICSDLLGSLGSF